jgi:hypothetical protein
MAYRLHRFDNVILPFYDPGPDFSQGPVDSSLLDSVGSAFDYYGTRQRFPRKQTIQIQGTYLGERSFFVDHNGNFFVDHSGNFFINGTAEGDLEAQVSALTAKLGQRGALFREHLRDATRLEWKTARLLAVSHPREQQDTSLLAKVTCVFETLMAAWRSESATTTSLGSGSGLRALIVPVSGNAAVNDAILAITAAATVTSIRVQHTGQGVDWTWAGSLTSGQVLTIDAGAQTVRIGSLTDAYSGLAYASGHTARGLLPLAPGTNPILVTTDANVSVALTHYNQWL